MASFPLPRWVSASLSPASEAPLATESSNASRNEATVNLSAIITTRTKVQIPKTDAYHTYPDCKICKGKKCFQSSATSIMNDWHLVFLSLLYCLNLMYNNKACSLNRLLFFLLYTDINYPKHTTYNESTIQCRVVVCEKDLHLLGSTPNWARSICPVRRTCHTTKHQNQHTTTTRN